MKEPGDDDDDDNYDESDESEATYTRRLCEQ